MPQATDRIVDPGPREELANRMLEELKEKNPRLYVKLLPYVESAGVNPEAFVQWILPLFADDQQWLEPVQFLAFRLLPSDLHLIELEIQKVVPAVVGVLNRVRNVPVRETVIDLLRCLGAFACSEATPVLVEIVRGERDIKIRKRATFALKKFGSEASTLAVRALLPSLADGDVGVRRTATKILGWFGRNAGAAIPELQRTRRDDIDERVRQLAEHTLAKIAREARKPPAVKGEQAYSEFKITQDAIDLMFQVQRVRQSADYENLEHFRPPGSSLHARRGGVGPRSQSRKGRSGPPVKKKVPNPGATLAPPDPPKRRVQSLIISSGERNYTLQGEGTLPIAVPENCKPLIALCVGKIQNDSPYEIIPWMEANMAVEGGSLRDDEIPKTASGSLRKYLGLLNRFGKKHFGEPPRGNQWFCGVRGQGIQLNSSVNWSISNKLKREFSVFAHPVNPAILADNQPAKGQKVPGRPRRGSSSSSDEDTN